MGFSNGPNGEVRWSGGAVPIGAASRVPEPGFFGGPGAFSNMLRDPMLAKINLRCRPGPLHIERANDNEREHYRRAAPLDPGEDELQTVTLNVCALCLRGSGGECHTPGCAFWMNRAPDIPLTIQDNEEDKMEEVVYEVEVSYPREGGPVLTSQDIEDAVKAKAKELGIEVSIVSVMQP